MTIVITTRSPSLDQSYVLSAGSRRISHTEKHLKTHVTLTFDVWP